MAQKRSTLLRSTLLRSAALLLLIGPGLMANAQDWKSEKKVNVLFGISQVLASGFNIEVNYISNRFIFDYSHGVALHFSGNTVTPELKREGVAVLMPWTTGFGIGYRITDWINIRMEPKWHRFEFYYKGDPQTSNNQLSSYNTFSLGLGLYGSWRPFKRKTNFLKGFMISPSIRFWPTVGSTRKDGFTYFNKNTAKYESIPKLDPGLGFTPLVANISVGYSFTILPSHRDSPSR